MRFVRLQNCKDGMIVGKNIYGQNGIMLLRYGTAVKQSHIEALQRLGYPGIYIDDSISKGIDIPEIVNAETQIKAKQAVKNLFAESKFAGLTSTANVVKEIEHVLADIITQILANKTMVANITSLKTFDNYTFQHCVDVCILSLILGQEFEMSRRTLEDLGKTALFHDIGKMFVPKSIINKPSSLTPDEFAEIKKHSKLGHDCLKNVLGQDKRVCEGVLYHHERYEGGGYPYGVEGTDIPFFAKIIAVTDVYDAITSKRIYKEAMIATEAYEYIMGNVGTHFDPVVVSAFMRKVPPFPVGSGVALSDGRKALVVENRANFMTRPLIKLFDEDVVSEQYIDLAQDAVARNITIVGAV